MEKDIRTIDEKIQDRVTKTYFANFKKKFQPPKTTIKKGDEKDVSKVPSPSEPNQSIPQKPDRLMRCWKNPPTKPGAKKDERKTLSRRKKPIPRRGKRDSAPMIYQNLIKH
jgi:hypothetical protein